MGKGDYIQLTIRIPSKMFSIIEEYRKEWGTSLQDTFLLILFKFLEYEEREGCER